MPPQLEQIRRLLATLTIRQKIAIGLAAVLVVAGLAWFAIWNKDHDFKPLYTELGQEDAGAVIAKLKEANVDYKLANGGATIRVPGARIDDLRIMMATAGLPKSGRIGYEIFDKTNFGITEKAENVNLHRAIEGELERTIGSIAEVEQARIHFTETKDSVFTEQREPAKASVMIRLRKGAKIPPANVQAIRQLVASSIPGLVPDLVSVVDMHGNLLSKTGGKGEQEEAAAASAAALEYRRTLEQDLLVKINATLEPLLGADRFRAGVSVTADMNHGEQSEETFDPDKTVMASSQKTEDSNSAAQASGVPGTQSTLPRPTSRPGSKSDGGTKTSETATYQNSRTVRKLKLQQGTVKHLSVAVLLDYAVRWENGKRTIAPLPAEQVKAIRDVVAGVSGVVNQRGDQLVVECLPFESTLAWQAPAPAAPGAEKPKVVLPGWVPSWLRPQLEAELQQLLGTRYFAAMFVMFLLALAGLFAWIVLKIMQRAGTGIASAAKRVKILKLGKKNGKGAAVEPVPGSPELADGQGEARARIESPAPGEHDEPRAGGRETAAQFAKRIEGKLSGQLEQRRRQEEEVLARLKAPEAGVTKTDILVRHISEEVEKDPQALAQLVRTWLEGS